MFNAPALKNFEEEKHLHLAFGRKHMTLKIDFGHAAFLKQLSTIYRKYDSYVSFKSVAPGETHAPK